MERRGLVNAVMRAGRRWIWRSVRAAVVTIFIVEEKVGLGDGAASK